MKKSTLTALPLILLAGSLSAQSPGETLAQVLDRIPENIMVGPDAVDAVQDGYEYRDMALDFDGVFRMDIPWLRESALRGGGVRIDIPERLEMIETETGEALGSVSHKGGQVSIIGDLEADHMVTAIAPEFGATLNISESGETFDATLNVEAFESMYNLGHGRVDTTSSAGFVTMDSEMPGIGGGVTNSSSSIMDMLVATSFPAAILDDSLTEGELGAQFLEPWEIHFSSGETKSVTSGITGIPGESEARVLTRSEDGRFSAMMQSGLFSMTSMSNGTTGEVEGLSFSQAPLGFAIETASIMMELPLAPGPRGSEASVDLVLQEMTLSDSAWDMFDPSGALPRDPVNVYLDISAPVSSAADVEALQAMIRDENMAGIQAYVFEMQPGEIGINALRVDMLGGSISAEGAIDGTSLVGFMNGLPPAGDWGDVTITLENTTAMIDAVRESGLADAQMLNFGTMMLNMYSEEVGPDLRSSQVELTGESILVNGQRVK